MRARPTTVAALAVLAAAGACAVAPSLMASADPSATDPLHALAAPSWGHPFGTDELGRDVWARVAHGAARSVGVGLGATAVGLLLGGAVGLLSGIGRGRAAGALARGVDVLLAFPSLLMALTIVALAGPGEGNVALALGIASLPTFARLVRGEVLRVRDQPYVDAAIAAGVRPATIIVRHVVPAIAAPVVAFAGLGVGVEVVAASSLSFLGFGPLPPATDWGSLIAAGRAYVADAWWIAVGPGVVIALTVLAIGRLAARVEDPGTAWEATR